MSCLKTGSRGYRYAPLFSHFLYIMSHAVCKLLVRSLYLFLLFYGMVLLHFRLCVSHPAECGNAGLWAGNPCGSCRAGWDSVGRSCSCFWGSRMWVPTSLWVREAHAPGPWYHQLSTKAVNPRETGHEGNRLRGVGRRCSCIPVLTFSLTPGFL